MPEPISEQERRTLLEEIARDPALKATQRLRALEELGRDARREAGRSAEDLPPEEQPDPFADFDEVEAARQRRARRRAS